MRRTFLLALLAVIGWAGWTKISGQAPAQTLRVAGNMTTIELSPVLLAANGIYKGPISVVNGGIPNLMNGEVDVATNAETQLLRQSVDDPTLRIIYTVSESFYRIVARRSSGISKVADLKGKKITTPANTSAHFYLVKTLGLAGIAENQFELVRITPVTKMHEALQKGEVDAVSMWEPESEIAADAIGKDAIVLQDRKVYRELFNLNTSTKVLADPAKRRAVVELLRSLNAASQKLRTNPKPEWPYIASKLNYTVETVEKSWPNLAYAGSIVPDMLDVLVEEEKWVAKERNRQPRGRAELSKLIDSSLLQEARR